LFYLPEDVDRGARADAIEESWWSWQEGEREVCPECEGMRLNRIARAVRLNVGQASRLSSAFMRSSDGRNKAKDRRDTRPTIDTFNRAAVKEVFDFFRRLKFKGHQAQIARDILPEIRERLRFLHEVGLGYLQLGRGVPTLSGGEAQRIRLAAQLGSNLSGVLYVLDEPTIGLHARDNEMLLATLAVLKSRGNSLIVVEHDEATMRHADFIIDLGPDAGVRGGKVVASGTLQELLRHGDQSRASAFAKRKGSRVAASEGRFQMQNPKSENRKKSEAQDLKSTPMPQGFGNRIGGFLRNSEFGIRI